MERSGNLGDGTLLKKISNFQGIMKHGIPSLKQTFDCFAASLERSGFLFMKSASVATISSWLLFSVVEINCRSYKTQ